MILYDRERSASTLNLNTDKNISERLTWMIRCDNEMKSGQNPFRRDPILQMISRISYFVFKTICKPYSSLNKNRGPFNSNGNHLTL